MPEDKSTTKGASDEAKAQAIAKMKAAQAENADNELDSSINEETGELVVKETEIDPDAKAALKDLLGKTSARENIIKLVKVYSPFRIYYENPATSVSALNGTGPFDILPGHKNFLTLLSSGDIKVRSPSGKEETINIERGVMHVHDNEVQVFLDV